MNVMKITVYTISDCQFSKQEKEYLAANKLPFEERNLETNKDYLTEMLAISNNFAGTPVTKVEKDDNQIIILKGFSKEEFDQAMGLGAAPGATLADAAPVAGPTDQSVGGPSPAAVATAAPAPVMPEPTPAVAPAMPAAPVMPTRVAEPAPMSPPPMAAAPMTPPVMPELTATPAPTMPEPMPAAPVITETPAVAPAPMPDLTMPTMAPATPAPVMPEPMPAVAPAMPAAPVMPTPMADPAPMTPPPLSAAPAPMSPPPMAAAPNPAPDNALSSILNNLQAKVTPGAPANPAGTPTMPDFNQK